MKLTNRLTLLIAGSVIGAVLAMIAGGAFSFRSIGLDMHHKKASSLVAVLDRQLDIADGLSNMTHWLPTLLRASYVAQLELVKDEQRLYWYRDSQAKTSPEHLVPYRFYLPRHPEVEAKLLLVRPFMAIQYSLQALAGISLAVLIVVLGLWQAIRWLRRELYGAEQLAERAARMLAGKAPLPHHDHRVEWPVSASQALDKLQAELSDARKERSRFDNFIRANAFIDEATGLGNRRFFENRLEHAMLEADVMSGGLLLITLQEQEAFGRDEISLLQQVSALVAEFARKHNGSLLARFDRQTLALLLPYMSESELSIAASSLLKSLARLPWPNTVDSTQAVHIGAVCYQAQDPLAQVIDDAQTALKSAQWRGSNGWSLYEKQLVVERSSKGSVRWRALLTHRLSQPAPAGLKFYGQALQAAPASGALLEQLLAYLDDEQGRALGAAIFIPMANKVGLQGKLERRIAQYALALTDPSHSARQAPAAPLCLSLSAASLLDKQFYHWLFFALFARPRQANRQLVIQLAESQLSRHYDALKKPLQALQSLGCPLCIDHAGQDVVSILYIKELDLNFLKIHPSLVRDISARQVNQMAVRSLVGGCANTRTWVLAEGVATEAEWQMLQHLGVRAGQGTFFARPEPLLSAPAAGE
ncbi:MAG: EAL domain-containing protein [Aeromonas sp.]